MYIYICIYLFVLCSKNDKNIYQNNVSKYTSSNEIRDIKIQFCKTLSKTIYQTHKLISYFHFKTFQEQFILITIEFGCHH